jgi:bifunctional non-homologous end joining protein LigD
MKAQTAEMLRVDGHEIKIARAAKVLFPEDGITKGDLIDYYQRISRWMVPHLAGRPLTAQRFPDGIGQPGFFQKAAGRYFPAWIKTATLRKVGGTVKYVICDDAATLVYLANQACITVHPWLSRADRPHAPDQLIFDLDPSGDDLAGVIEAAHALRRLLDKLELPAYLKATGSRGLHIVTPLDGSEDFDAVRAVARALAGMVVAGNPARFTIEQYKNKRRGRVFLDVNRNAYAQTAVAAYTVRARPGAPVAAPLDWSELGRKGFRPDGVTLRNIFARLEKIADPWRDFGRRPASLAKARRALEQADAA